jgi:hypothetical protein
MLKFPHSGSQSKIGRSSIKYSPLSRRSTECTAVWFNRTRARGIQGSSWVKNLLRDTDNGKCDESGRIPVANVQVLDPPSLYRLVTGGVPWLYMEFLLFAALIGLLSAAIAKGKGRSFGA